MNYKKFVTEVFKEIGIEINGSSSWDIQVQDDEFYKMLVNKGGLGLGESYMLGMWECQAVDQFIAKILAGNIEQHVKSLPFSKLAKLLLNYLVNPQSIAKSKKVGKQHYDLGNNLYSIMLDEELNYSCGYWQNASNLKEAQFNKLDLICRKINLKSGDRVLDIGCGWGSFARHAAKYYDAKVVGVTISLEQYTLAQELSKDYDIELRLQDYRKLSAKQDGLFDHIVSIGMFEHVGCNNYKKYFKKAAELLKNEGVFLLHTIGSKITMTTPDPWIQKYIFANSVLPSAKLITANSEKYFCIEDWHNFGIDYDATLMAWHDNFNKHWETLKPDYDDIFFRMWNYYLLACAGAFRCRDIHLWQIVLSKGGVKGGYQSVR